MAKFKVLGNEGEKVEIDGVEYDGGVGTIVELEGEVAEAAVAASKVEAVADEAAGGDTTGGEQA